MQKCFLRIFIYDNKVYVFSAKKIFISSKVLQKRRKQLDSDEKSCETFFCFVSSKLPFDRIFVSLFCHLSLLRLLLNHYVFSLHIESLII